MTLTGLTAVAQPDVISFTRQNGIASTITQIFAGANAKANAQAFCAQYSFQCESWDVSPMGDGVAYKATVKFAGESGGPNEPLSDAWELQPNAVEKDFLEADITLTNSFTAEEIAIIKEYGNDASLDVDPAVAADVKKCINLNRAGVKSVRVFAPTLRHTLIVRQDYTVRDSLTNVGKVLTNIQSTESVPSVLLFNLPATGAVTRQDNLEMKTGWLKKSPAITQVAGGKWQISQEWEYGLWSTDLYTTVP